MACIPVDSNVVFLVAILTAPRIARDAIEAYQVAQATRNEKESE